VKIFQIFWWGGHGMGEIVFYGCSLLGIIGGFLFHSWCPGIFGSNFFPVIIGWGIGMLLGLYLYDKV
jgi:hypothetical protein